MPKPTAELLAETEKKIALVEQRTTAIETFQLRFETKLDRLIDKLDTQVVTKKEHDIDMKNIKADFDDICKRLKHIEDNMVTKESMKNYRNSQFWQKFLVAVGTGVITALVVYEITK